MTPQRGDRQVSITLRCHFIHRPHLSNVALKRRDLAAACLHDERDIGQCLVIKFLSWCLSVLSVEIAH